MIDLVHGKKVPVELSQYIRDRAYKGFFFRVQHNGISYYIPVSIELKKLFGISIRNGHANFKNYGVGLRMDDILTDVVGSVYLQIRDTVGNEIKTSLHTEMENSFSKLFAKTISGKVDEVLDKRIPLLLEKTNDS